MEMQVRNTAQMGKALDQFPQIEKKMTKTLFKM